MKLKLFIKIIIDILMLIIMTIIMGYHLLTPLIHEILGIVLFVLYLLHLGLNYKWFIRLFIGRYNLSRIYKTVLNLSLLVIIVLIILSSFMISLEVFKFSNFGSAAFGRTIHLVCTLWCFILVSMHFGMHLNMMKNILLKHMKKRMNWIFRTIFIISFGYMIYVFINRQFIDILFHKTDFPYFPYGESFISFLIDYLTIIIGFAGVAHYLNKCLLTISKLRNKKTQENLAKKEQNI